ncbi:MAG TPA: ATP-binding protein [Thermoanaerobaculia bacterium]|nr:ATP-binding protein [Thermoanaerobaculia bacterium]
MRPVAHDRRIVLLALGAAIPGIVTALAILWTGDYSSKVRWTLTVLIVLTWLGFTQALRERVIRPLQTVSNLLAAMREEDFSIRARGARGDDPLGEVLVEVNALAETLREQRLGALEATALLSRVMEEIAVAVFAFDGEGALQLVNRFGERLLGQPEPRLRGRRAEELGLKAFLEEGAPQILEAGFPGGSGRWEIRRSVFRQGGAPHRLLVLADVSRPLREEERQAWQRLIRVLGHELNNSLAPIQSIAGSLQKLSAEPEPPADWRADLRQGLSIIASRAEALSRFTTAYAKLARLPPPRPAPVAIDALVRRAAGLETRLPVGVIPGPPVVLEADSDQLDQLLINLVRNATDAAIETQGGVAVGWKRTGRRLEIWVADDGPGLPNTTNLFVPFFTTKPGGSGIGLVLSRQIAEAHGGTLTLENRKGHRGCIAWLRLPLTAA